MKVLTITHEGIEDIAAKEVREILNQTSEGKEGIVITPVKSVQEACKYCYESRAAIKVVWLLSKFNVLKDLEKTIGNMKKNVELEQVKELIQKNRCRINCERKGEHNYSSQDITHQFGKYLEEEYSVQMDFKNNTLEFYTYIKNDKGYFGIDLSGVDLSKREHHIFMDSKAIKSDISYALVRFVDYDKNKTLLDPFCSSGLITIEAALYAKGVSVNKYRRDRLAFTHIKGLGVNEEEIYKEKEQKIKRITGLGKHLKHIMASRKNAKIAGINKEITYTRVDLDWIETKIEQESIDRIITQLPADSKRVAQSDIRRLYSEFLKQSRKALKQDGKIGVAVEKTGLIKEEIEKEGLKLSKEKRVMQGEKELYLLEIMKE